MKINKLLVYSVLILIIAACFYSCTLIGIGKIERVNMFITTLNESTGDEASVNNILSNFSSECEIYDQIKTPDWWESSVFSVQNQDFNISSATEEGNTVTANITSGGGLDAPITFTMVQIGFFDWFIKKINIDGDDIIY